MSMRINHAGHDGNIRGKINDLSSGRRIALTHAGDLVPAHHNGYVMTRLGRGAVNYGRSVDGNGFLGSWRLGFLGQSSGEQNDRKQKQSGCAA